MESMAGISSILDVVRSIRSDYSRPSHHPLDFLMDVEDSSFKHIPFFSLSAFFGRFLLLFASSYFDEFSASSDG